MDPVKEQWAQSVVGYVIEKKIADGKALHNNQNVMQTVEDEITHYNAQIHMMEQMCVEELNIHQKVLKELSSLDRKLVLAKAVMDETKELQELARYPFLPTLDSDKFTQLFHAQPSFKTQCFQNDLFKANSFQMCYKYPQHELIKRDTSMRPRLKLSTVEVVKSNVANRKTQSNESLRWWVAVLAEEPKLESRDERSGWWGN
ncbi:hypothetical protein QJS10_CPA10g01708 [Acorus calamus]|uniref:Uncharacterized protein n=1 Tax=Acorus calamus TaxID=4465 RepID=A0AAV9DZ29_ACOCL|nr:hypothetical protein QJS10_CPA10g01708 [Acorus calamus]